MRTLHRAHNLRFVGYDKASGRFTFTVKSATRIGMRHTFSVRKDGTDARCTCDSFLGKGWCHLTRDALAIALRGYAGVFGRMGDRALMAQDRAFAARTDLNPVERQAWSLLGDMLAARLDGAEAA
jgi:hypothetical protein